MRRFRARNVKFGDNSPEVYPQTAPANPAAFATESLHLNLDPVQHSLLHRDPHRAILNCCRQWGKSTITAAKAVHTAITQPGSLTTVLSPSARQSAEFLRKASHFVRRLNLPIRGDGDNDISLLLPNQSRIVGLPGKDSTIRGFSAVSLLLIDEAARVPDELYDAVRPMLATSDGQLWLISTPNGRTGFFYDTWSNNDPQWMRVSVPATQCPRIKAAYLERERKAMPPHTFRQEFLCEFVDAEDSFFSTTLIEAARSGMLPIDFAAPVRWRAEAHSPHYFLGLDLGQTRDFTAIAIIERATEITGPRNLATYEFPAETTYNLRYLERLPLGTLYTDIAQYVRSLIVHPALSNGPRSLVVDATGVGRPVVDLIRNLRIPCHLVPVTLTAGNQTATFNSEYRVPRTDLLTHLEIAFQARQLKISRDLRDINIFTRELQHLRRSEATAAHDDYVFAVALAMWRAATTPQPRILPRLP